MRAVVFGVYHTQESKLLGTLLPSSPDFIPIVQQLREKYGLRKVSPDDDPIEGIFLNRQLAPLLHFRAGLRFLVQSASERLPPLLA
jgi:hypothetical protein